MGSVVLIACGKSLWECFYFVSEAMSSTEVEDGVGSVGWFEKENG